MAVAPTTANAAGSPFFDISLSDMLKAGTSYLSSLQDTRTAQALAQAQQSAKPVQTIPTVSRALTQPTTIANVAVVAGSLFMLFAGGLWLIHKVK